MKEHEQTYIIMHFRLDFLILFYYFWFFACIDINQLKNTHIKFVCNVGAKFNSNDAQNDKNPKVIVQIINKFPKLFFILKAR